MSDTVTLLIAVWGALTGTLSLALAFAAYKRDRSSIRVSTTTGRILTASTQSPFMMFIEASNRGRREVQLVSAGIETTKGDRFAAFGDLRTLPAVVGEGRSVSVHVAAVSLVENTIRVDKGVPTVAFVRDATGKEYRAPISKKTWDAVERSVAASDAEPATPGDT